MMSFIQIKAKCIFGLLVLILNRNFKV